MTIFATTSVLFLAALILHLLLWKIRLPKFHTRTLLILFALVFGAWLLSSPLSRITWPELIHIALYYTALSLCYVITYSAIEGDSPTLSLIRHLHQKGGQGMSREEVCDFLEARPFINARIAALLRDGLLREEDGRYFAVGGGSLFFRAILGFRQLYGPIERGG